MRGLRPFILLGLEHNAMSLLHSIAQILPNHCTYLLHILPGGFFNWQHAYTGRSHSMHQMLNNTFNIWRIWQLMMNTFSKSAECCQLIGLRLSIVQLKPATARHATFRQKRRRLSGVLTCPHCRHSLARSGLIPPLRKLAGIVIIKTLLGRRNFGGCNSCALAPDYAASQSNNQDSFHFLPPNLIKPRT